MSLDLRNEAWGAVLGFCGSVMPLPPDRSIDQNSPHVASASSKGGGLMAALTWRPRERWRCNLRWRCYPGDSAPSVRALFLQRGSMSCTSIIGRLRLLLRGSETAGLTLMP